MIASVFSNWGAWLPDFLEGLFVSLQLTAAILVTGLPLGILLAAAITSPRRWLRWSGLVVVELGRGIPAFVILLLVYYGLPQADVLLPAFACGVIAFGLALGAYTSEVFRAAFAAIPVGQREASDALGLRGWDTFRHVTLPQALRIATPALLGWAILFFQATSLCFTIAVPELMTVAYNEGSVTLDYLGAFILAGVLYACISVPASYLVTLLERRLESDGQPVVRRRRLRGLLPGGRSGAPPETAVDRPGA